MGGPVGSRWDGWTLTLFRLIQEAEDPDPAQPLLSAPEEASVRRYLELPDEARAHVDAVIAAFAGEGRR